MKNSFVSLVVSALTLLSLRGIAAAAENTASAETPKTVAAETTPTSAASAAKPAASSAEKTDGKNATAAAAKKPAGKGAEPKSKAELEGKLPEVEVNKSKVTILDHELHEQDRLIAIEKKNTKASELDSALNSPGGTPSILGGYSSKVRSGIAQERVELMELEKELTELMARARTKEEKAALKKQIDDLRTMRRELDGATESKSRANR